MNARSKTVLAVATALTLFAVTPALAFPAWQCTAKNARGAKYTASAWGVFSQQVKERASAKALAACVQDTVIVQSCVIITCTQTAN